jgi:hypothetical protein
MRLSPYPNGKLFAFSIVDDTDDATYENIKPIYDLLKKLGLRTTKTVWVEDAIRSCGFPEKKDPPLYGDSLIRKEYCNYLKRLHKDGFEIAMHTVSGGNNYRNETLRGYEKFKEIFGDYPKMNINHAGKADNIYNDGKRFKSTLIKGVYSLVDSKKCFGEVEGSKYFWGDICAKHTKYVRRFITNNINTLKINPEMPYHNDDEPYVNYWFAASCGEDCSVFNKLLSPHNIIKLQRERGACIVYTHFGKGFATPTNNGAYQINPFTVIRLSEIANQQEGWFETVYTILDRLLLMRQVVTAESKEAFFLHNLSYNKIEGVTLFSRPNSVYYEQGITEIRADAKGTMVIGELNRGETRVFCKSQLSDLKKSNVSSYRKVSLNIQHLLSRLV